MNTSKTLLQILVEELPGYGGWPSHEREMRAVQDGDREVKFHFTGHSLEFARNSRLNWGSNTAEAWLANNMAGCNFVSKTLASDYATAIITRDQYEAALAAQAPVANTDGWIDWAGGECPVSSHTSVDVKFRDSSTDYGNSADSYTWKHSAFGMPGLDIIAYRLHQPQDANSRANDDRLEADLNECIGQAPGAPLWDGQGLPPVGVEFNYGSHRSRAKCLAVGLHYVFASKGNPDDEEGDYEELMIDAQTEFHPVHEDSDQMMRDIMKSSCVGAAAAVQIANQLIAAGYRKQ